MKPIGYALFTLFTAATAGCAGKEGRSFEHRWKNKPAPDFELTALGGGTVKLSDQRGKSVVLAFWAHG